MIKGSTTLDYRTEITVRGYHADFYGHVNNARYLEFLEEDRWARIEEVIDLPKWKKLGLIFLVVNININYCKAIPVGETVVLTTDLSEIGHRSCILKQQVLIKETSEVAADALVTFVIMDRTGRAAVLEGEIREELEKLTW
jgi:thioesterase-3